MKVYKAFLLTNIWELTVGSHPQATTISDIPVLNSMLSTADSQEEDPRLRRTSVVKLIVTDAVEAKLKALCSLSSKLWNEVNYVRRMQFFGNKGVNLKGTYKEFYEKYKKLIGSATAQQILNKNNEAWSSFFDLLKAKKEGKLPSFVTKVSPPGYKKKGKTRELWVVLRNDQYKIEENKIVLKGLGAIGRIEMEYTGLIHLKGKQGRLEIHYNDNSWYAHISFEIEEKAVRGIWRKVPQKPKGDLKAGIDLGVNNLFAVYVENGVSALVNGRPLKSESHYWRERIAKYQSNINKYGVKTSRKLNAMYNKWRKRAKSFIDTQVRRIVEWIYEIGVSTIYVGYPKNIAQQKGNFNISNVWSYDYVIKRLSEVSEEYGIKVQPVNEAYTSSTCPIHGSKCGNRIVRGLFKCTMLNKVFNADIVGAFNILRKSITPSPSRIGVTGRKPNPGLNEKDVALNLSALMGVRTLAL